MVDDCGNFIAICRVSPGGVLWVFMTSPNSMLIPDHCVRKGQHSTFDDSQTGIYLRGAWEKFAGNVTIRNSIILVICVHTQIFCDWKWQITNLSRRSSSARIITTWHLSKGGSESVNPLYRFRMGWCCATATNQSSLPRILGISDIYRWTAGPLWIYILNIFPRVGAWDHHDHQWKLFFSHF